jgi:murein L,D-transpeptidase YafK
MMRRFSLGFAVAVALALPSATTTARFAPTKAQAESNVKLTTEALLQKAFDEIARQRFDTALVHIESVLREQPNFRLAHLIKGDLLLARVKQIPGVGAGSRGPAERLSDFREEAMVRLKAVKERPPEDSVPRYLLQLRPDQKHAIVVDTTRSRLYLYRNEGDRPRLVADYYISVGKRGAVKMREGDQKTPVGVYHVTSSLNPRKLGDFYGSGAFPINYPNDWDKRMGRNGHGIWLHGVPSDTYARAPRSSDGCVVLSNADLDALADHLQIGLTPVIIAEEVEWLPADAWKAERREFFEQLDRWRADWESRDADRYLGHYSKQFSSGKQDLADWSRHKKQVNTSKAWIKVGLSNVTAFRTPGKEDVMVVTFDQDYRSSSLSNVSKKRQYWQREGSRWRIIYEGSA